MSNKKPSTKVLGINMPVTMEKELTARAKRMRISKSNYCKIILQDWIASGKKLTISE